MNPRQKALLYTFPIVCALLSFGITYDGKAADSEPAKAPQVNQGGKKLLLNGRALRTKYTVKVYRVELYLTKKSSSEKAIYKDPAKKRVYIKMLREVSGKKFDATVRKNIKENFSKEEQKKYKKELEAFLACFYDKVLHDGCEVTIDYIPKQGTEVGLDGKVLDLIKGDEFYSHLLRLWIGKPLQKSIKTGLLGKA